MTTDTWNEVLRAFSFDQAFDLWLETGHYASRPPGEVHGPFHTDIGCIVLEISFPDRVAIEASSS